MKPTKPKRPVPQPNPDQVAFHGGLTANPAAFSLEKVASKTAPELLGGGDNAALHAVGELLDAELEAERLKRNALFALKEASIARTMVDANAAFKAGKLKPLPAVQRVPTALRVRTPKDVLLSATKPVPAAQVQAYVENHHQGKNSRTLNRSPTLSTLC